MAVAIRALWSQLQCQRISMAATTPPPPLPVKTLRPLLRCRAISAAATTPPAPTVHDRDKIELTDVEKKIFNRLLGTQLHFGVQSQLRVAGGWVRDKLKITLKEHKPPYSICLLTHNALPRIEDLKFGRIATPSPAKDSFIKDPIRVLRAIRFGAQFEFILVEELQKAAASEDVKVALATKISRDRIKTENYRTLGYLLAYPLETSKQKQKWSKQKWSKQK